MKKLFLLLSSGFILFSFSALSQTFWDDVPLPEPVTEVAAINVDENGTLFLGSQDDVYYSTDYGETWTESNNWPGHNPNCFGFNSSDHIFIGTFSNGMYRSTNGGNTFSEINNGLSFWNVWDILVMENDDILIATPGGIFKSSNNGNQWNLFGTGLPADEIEKLIRAENGTLFAGTFGSGMYRSFDDGASWTACNSGLPASAMITAGVGAPNGYIFAGIFPEGMFRSTNNGDSWEAFNMGLPFLKLSGSPRGLSVVDIKIQLLFVVCIVYFHGAFYRSFDSDNRDEWLPIIDGLPGEPTTTALSSGSDNRMFLGTYDQGLYRSSWVLQIPDPPGITDNYSVTVFPNPFRTVTTIEFHIPDNEQVKIQLFSPIGQLISILSKDTYTKGFNKIVWEPEGVTPGLYYLRFQAGSFTGTRKLIIK